MSRGHDPLAGIATGGDPSPAVEQRCVEGRSVTIVRSRTAVSEHVSMGSGVLVLDLDRIAVSPVRVTEWTLQVAQDSRVVLLTAEGTEPPVEPLAVDGLLTSPLTDERLRELLDEFARRDRYASLLTEYEQCVEELAAAEGRDRRELTDRAAELETRLARFERTADDRTYGRTMREILQRAE